MELLTQLREARRLTEEARWALLDLVVAMNAMELDLVRELVAAVPWDIIDKDESANHEDYQPDNDDAHNDR